MVGVTIVAVGRSLVRSVCSSDTKLVFCKSWKVGEGVGSRPVNAARAKRRGICRVRCPEARKRDLCEVPQRLCVADDDVVVGVLRGWEGYRVVTDEKTGRLIGAALLAGPRCGEMASKCACKRSLRDAAPACKRQ